NSGNSGGFGSKKTIAKPPHTEDPYRDVKNFIRDVGNNLRKRSVGNDIVEGSENRWSYLEEKYNIQ
ncbi:MAG: hypothetical protein AAF975_06010, partial [Spirochaetota bacterium]